jgi:hypothetical protein
MTLVPQQTFYENSDDALCCYGFNTAIETEKKTTFIPFPPTVVVGIGFSLSIWLSRVPSKTPET